MGERSKAKAYRGITVFILTGAFAIAGFLRTSAEDMIEKLSRVREAEDELRTANETSMRTSFSRIIDSFTNAVVAIDSADSEEGPPRWREMFRLAKVGTNRWATVGSTRIDLAAHNLVGYWQTFGFIANHSDGGLDLSGLRYDNTLMIAIGASAVRAREVRETLADGARMRLEIYEGWRKTIPNDSFCRYAIRDMMMPPSEDLGPEHFFDWPSNGRGKSESTRSRLWISHRGLWVMRCSSKGMGGKTAEVWSFGYRRMPTAEELHNELKRLLHAGRKKKRIKASTPLKP